MAPEHLFHSNISGQIQKPCFNYTVAFRSMSNLGEKKYSVLVNKSNVWIIYHKTNSNVIHNTAADGWMADDTVRDCVCFFCSFSYGRCDIQWVIWLLLKWRWAPSSLPAFVAAAVLSPAVEGLQWHLFFSLRLQRWIFINQNEIPEVLFASEF